MSTLSSWTDREGLMNRTIQAGSMTAELGGAWHEERTTQDPSLSKVHLGPINELGWRGWEQWKRKTERCSHVRHLPGAHLR